MRYTLYAVFVGVTTNKKSKFEERRPRSRKYNMVFAWSDGMVISGQFIVRSNVNAFSAKEFADSQLSPSGFRYFPDIHVFVLEVSRLGNRR